MKQGWVTVFMMCALVGPAHGAYNADKKAFAFRQDELDRQCEAARAEKLAPLREATFQECMNATRSTRSTRSEAECRRKTMGENGNRVGGAPRFYDLPACVKAFKHKSKRP